MEVKIDDRLLEEASPEVAKAYVRIMMDDQGFTVFNIDQVQKLKAVIDFLIANWRGPDAET